MRFRFADAKLERLYFYGTRNGKYPQGVVEAFLRRVRTIESTTDVRGLRALKSLHLEKLKSKKNQHSIRLNKSWRLILTFEKSKEGKKVVLIEINKHYGD